jgi:hypothetical protein
MQAMKTKAAEGKPVDEEGRKLTFELQLYACTFRRAIRSTVRRIGSSIKSAGGGPALTNAEFRAAADICQLVHSTDAAIKALQDVSCAMQKHPTYSISSVSNPQCLPTSLLPLYRTLSPIFPVALSLAVTFCVIADGEFWMQACKSCDSPSTPAWIREAWQLVEEQVLLEARVSLLKLITKLEAASPEHSQQMMQDLPVRPLAQLPCAQSLPGHTLSIAYGF